MSNPINTAGMVIRGIGSDANGKPLPPQQTGSAVPFTNDRPLTVNPQAVRDFEAQLADQATRQQRRQELQDMWDEALAAMLERIIRLSSEAEMTADTGAAIAGLGTAIGAMLTATRQADKRR